MLITLAYPYTTEGGLHYLAEDVVDLPDPEGRELIYDGRGRLAPDGTPSSASYPLRVRGVYANDTAYLAGDVVTHIGYSFYALMPFTSASSGFDATKWQPVGSPSGLPLGGAANMILGKLSDEDLDLGWLPSAALSTDPATSQGTAATSGATGDGSDAGHAHDPSIAQNFRTGTAYTLVLGDASKVVDVANAAANTVTIPPASSVAFPVGTVVTVRQYGAGQTTIAPGAGVTVRSAAGALKISAQYGEASLFKRAANEWVVAGALTT